MKTTKLLFPTPIWEDDDCGLDTKEIQDFCYLVEKEDPQGRKATNYGGWQSNEFRPEVLPDTPLKSLYYSLLSDLVGLLFHFEELPHLYLFVFVLP